LVRISFNHWLLAIALSIIPVAINELIKFHRLSDEEE